MSEARCLLFGVELVLPLSRKRDLTISHDLRPLAAMSGLCADASVTCRRCRCRWCSMILASARSLCYFASLQSGACCQRFEALKLGLSTSRLSREARTRPWVYILNCHPSLLP